LEQIKVKKGIKEVKNIYAENKVVSMEFNYYIRCQEVFGANTDFDVITVKKEKYKGKTLVRTKTDGEIEVNLKDYDIIPTDRFDLLDKLKAKDDEERVEFLYSRSAYGSDKKNMCSVEDSVFRFHVVYGYPEKEGLKLFYSNTKDNGHFGASKLIIVKASKY